MDTSASFDTGEVENTYSYAYDGPQPAGRNWVVVWPEPVENWAGILVSDQH